ncbi:MAG: pyridoxamine 5'-phosphate oxidase family protein, partial [Rhizonema sp. PD38]|nr:pyridoxamine 5'-phosphate oxidase family protein [Rhizonema sp. PD38]
MSQFETALTTYRSFTDRFQSIVIGTVSEDGIPNASYVPSNSHFEKNTILIAILKLKK